jgi:hypothetical protein
MKFKDKNFKNEKIDIDFNQFSNCQFDSCTLVFHGYGVIGMDGCSFINVNWTFDGAAAKTLQFMHGLYHGAGEGGRQLIESTFNSIRQGDKNPSFQRTVFGTH